MSTKSALVIDKYLTADIPIEEWDIVSVFDDILMCKFVDIPEGDDGTHIMRNGIAIPLDVTRHTWRVVEVLKVGIRASEHIAVGDTLMIPNDRGLACVKKSDEETVRLIFINEDRVFCKVTKRDVDLS